MAIVFDGVQIETTPGAMLKLACGDHDMAEGVFEVGAAYTCREAECGAQTVIVELAPFEIVPTVTVAK